MRDGQQLREKYVNWIFSELRIEKRVARKWQNVCMILMDIDYEPTTEFDINRAEDGLYLRRGFVQDGDQGVFGEAKVLEVLAEFAIRIDSEYIGDPSDPYPGGIFIMFLENLDLGGCENVKKNQKTFLNRRVTHWMRDDPGLIFGFRNSPKSAQLWSFMLKWVSNNGF